MAKNDSTKLMILRKSERKPGWWVWCQCTCGTVKELRQNDVRRGHTKSCGCESSKMKGLIHGMAGTQIYIAWRNMISRCTKPHDASYANYGGRGIKVHQPWFDFEKFYADVGDVPEGLTLDRIDHEGNYEPGNVRWGDWVVQARNKRNNRMYEFDGVTKCQAEWAEFLGVSPQVIAQRIKRNGADATFRYYMPDGVPRDAGV